MIANFITPPPQYKRGKPGIRDKLQKSIMRTDGSVSKYVCRSRVDFLLTWFLLKLLWLFPFLLLWLLTFLAFLVLATAGIRVVYGKKQELNIN